MRPLGAEIQYRPEIDGLRAVAVIPVILFHAGFSTFGGGYVGVDVFFVISGYLITSIILRELERGTFTFAKFYERRARRILPALYLMMLCCLPFAWMWMLPKEFKDFAASLQSVVLFVSNIAFWAQSGYFATAAELKPLLHTWSLAVEEQFYLLFPVALLFLWRHGRRKVALWLALAGLASLLLSEFLARAFPNFNFFWLPPRIWELMAGALCAFARIGRNRLRDNLLSLAGLAAILAAVFAFDRNTPMPSLYGVLPVGGACLILAFGVAGTATARLLSLPAVVGVGLISYSAYLWHQPLLAFARIRILTEPSPLTMAALVAATFPLAWLSWRFVETPFRKGGAPLAGEARRSFPPSLALGVGTAALLSLFSLIVLATGGFPSRLPEKVAAAAAPPLGKIAACDETIRRLHGPTCVIGAPGEKPTLAIVGDSHAGRFMRVLDEVFAKAGVSAVVYAQTWCAPLLDFGADHPRKNPQCRAFMNEAYADLAGLKEIRTVILISQWANYTKGLREGDVLQAYYTDAQSGPPSLAENAAAFQRALLRTKNLLDSEGKRLILVATPPEYAVNVSAALARNLLFSGKPALDPHDLIDRAAYQARNAEVFAAFDGAGLDRGAMIDSFALFCPQGVCTYADAEARPYYEDYSHLSYLGTTLFIPAFGPLLASPK